jgi:hypothetical protein
MNPWTTQRCPNHVARAAGPADVLARVLDRDGKIISAAVVALFRAGWAASDIVVPHCAELGLTVIEDAEFWPTYVSPDLRFSLRLDKLRWDGLPRNQSRKQVAGHLGKRIQVAHLLLKIFTGTGKPEALGCASVDAQRPPDGIAVPAGLQSIVLGEDLDSFLLAPLDRDTQPQGKATNVYSAIPRWERLRHEDPGMPSPMAFLKSRLHPVLLEVEAELEKVRKRILIVCVDGHPFRTLGCRVDRVEADGDFAFEVAADCVQRETKPLAGLPVLGPIVIVAGTFRVGSIGLKGVGPPVDEEAEVIPHHAGWRFETKIPHFLLREVRWAAPLLHVGGEMMRVVCYTNWLGNGHEPNAHYVIRRGWTSGWVALSPGIVLKLKVFAGLLAAGIQIDDVRLPRGIGHEKILRSGLH